MIKAVGTNVVLKPIEVEKKTEGGLIKPDDFIEREGYKTSRGTIVDMGSEAFKLSGRKIDSAPKVGDTVLFPTYEGSLEDVGNTTYRILADDHITAVIDNV